MYCKWCGSEIPEDAKICPHCGEVLRDKEAATPEREGARLEEEIERDLYAFFNKNIGSAYSVNALKNRLSEIVKDYTARAYSSQHLQKILYKMTQKGHLKASYHNNETHYHFLEAKKEEPAKTTYTGESLKKLHDIPPTTQSILKEPIEPHRTEHIKPRNEGKIAALVVTGVIGGILLLVGILYLSNAIGGGFFWTGLPTGATLAIIGIIILAVVLGIASKGACCADFFCDDCCCDAC
ncbi:MAG: zinc ribbon domain-containing protein [Candidatus Lokiarchaeota archaeon]|nr:zinc ribbon domain-containing protein [Candidatus Lokiarchaeota archaeon]